MMVENCHAVHHPLKVQIEDSIETDRVFTTLMRDEY